MIATTTTPPRRRLALSAFALFAAAVLTLLVSLSVAHASVTFTDFSASRSSTGVLITWSTATEIKTAGFRVLASTAPNVPPTPLSGLIPAQGDSFMGMDYSFTDRNGTATTRYFIEVVMLDQSTELVGPLLPLSAEPATRLFLPLVVVGR